MERATQAKTEQETLITVVYTRVLIDWLCEIAQLLILIHPLNFDEFTKDS